LTPAARRPQCLSRTQHEAGHPCGIPAMTFFDG
jgi:hypothetical protein